MPERPFPHAVREIEHAWIPMTDGCRLAARLWLPAGAEAEPVPAVLEYIPYRKRDFTRLRDEPMHRYFAGHGFAAVRVDVRGTGDSDGLMVDEYTEREQLDGVEAIAWVAAQPWCSGAVGMIGKSWGGFNALQIAARRPPALMAVISVCAADDRYADDAHYMGGCLLGENQVWGTAMLAVNAQPPDPRIVGGGWREAWRARIEETPVFPAIWLRHPHRDDYWKRGSVCEDYAAIECAVYAVGGWADGYRNAIPRLLAGLSCPRRGLIGPWAHVYPHDGIPGPAIGFLQEAVRWWEHWLAGRDTGIMAEPMLRAWMQESVPPQGFYETRPGRWVAEPAWQAPGVAWRDFALDAEGLARRPGAPRALTVSSPQTVGLAAGVWCAFGGADEMPIDQRADDAGSLVFDSAPLAEPMEVLGAPEVDLELAADRPAAFVAVRLNDLRPDGSVARVTYGLLNLAHREGHDRPRPVVPGRRMRVRVALNHIAHAFPAGHRLRIAVSTAYWPIAWPSPEPVTLTLVAGASRLRLPVRTPRPEDDALRPFAPPAAAEADDWAEIRPGRQDRRVERDPATGAVELQVAGDGPDFQGARVAHLPSIGLRVEHGIRQRYRIHPDDPLSAVAEVRHDIAMSRPGWHAEIEVATRLSGSGKAFRLSGRVAARHNGAPVAARAFDEWIARDGD